jgi:hypothetical protein
MMPKEIMSEEAQRLTEAGGQVLGHYDVQPAEPKRTATGTTVP